MTIAAFDFDGTITKRDTFIAFILFAKGWPALFIGILKYSTWLALYALRLYPNWKIKEKLFSYFFAGVPLSVFDKWCTSFYNNSKNIVYSEAVLAVRHHIELGHTVVIVTASIENWVLPFAKAIGANTVIGTKAEVSEGRLTGKFATMNCYGSEKVSRFCKTYPNRDSYTLIAYGDSRGDSEMLAFADKGVYRPFKQ